VGKTYSTSENPVKHRNPFAMEAKMSRGGIHKDRREGRGGSRNETLELLSEAEEDQNYMDSCALHDEMEVLYDEEELASIKEVMIREAMERSYMQRTYVNEITIAHFESDDRYFARWYDDHANPTLGAYGKTPEEAWDNLQDLMEKSQKEWNQ